MAPPATFIDSMALQEVVSPPPDIKPATSASDHVNDAVGKRRVFRSTSVTGHFLISGKPKLPLIYTVDVIREGKNYCTRYVQVRQPSPAQQDRPLEADVIFIATVSFKTEEPEGLESQVSPPKELKNWISNPQKCEIAPAVDVPSWIEFTKRKGMRNVYTAVDLRKVNVEEENKARPLHKHRKVQIYRPVGSLPPEELSALSICAHVYASDRNGMFAVTGPHNLSDNILHTGSLSHTVVFHANPSKLLFNDAANEDDPSAWTILEQFGDSASEGRGLIRSRMWSADGTLLASILQDALIRVRIDGDGKWSGKIDRRQMTFAEQLKSML
ncbi:hypothetical protein H072_6964 [Dactylellina haptotyla CBS 200.50]|uniref:Acyl-CoA thioesterase II domain-containing protein n=1 Tax=Dactylellina haptotyla (strain CBS 200.50) TaxID=1284197 RepID=S8A8A5_DACHA|nr:hypothetical protein H072_6964 [Dactylellina haptotyla CBS 200.50]